LEENNERSRRRKMRGVSEEKLGESGRRRLREKPKGSGTVRTVIPDIG
jgi:hypothetical protein